MIGIIGAMDVEIAALAARMELARREVFSGMEYIRGKLFHQEVALARCGVGKVNAAVCAQTMALKYQPELVLNSGVAGALNPKLRVGDIVVGQGVVQHDVDTTALGDAPGFVSTVNILEFPLDARISEEIFRAGEALSRSSHPAGNREGIRLLRGKIASGDQFVGSEERKRQIVSLFRADCCEMEAGAIAQVCYLNRIPCAVVRAISDGGDENASLAYEEFLPMAAQNSANLVLKFLELREKAR